MMQIYFVIETSNFVNIFNSFGLVFITITIVLLNAALNQVNMTQDHNALLCQGTGTGTMNRGIDEHGCI